MSRVRGPPDLLVERGRDLDLNRPAAPSERHALRQDRRSEEDSPRTRPLWSSSLCILQPGATRRSTGEGGLRRPLEREIARLRLGFTTANCLDLIREREHRVFKTAAVGRKQVDDVLGRAPNLLARQRIPYGLLPKTRLSDLKAYHCLKIIPKAHRPLHSWSEGASMNELCRECYLACSMGFECERLQASELALHGCASGVETAEPVGGAHERGDHARDDLAYLRKRISHT